MKIERAISLAGGTKELAHVCGVTHPAVLQWKEKGAIPQARLWQLRLLKPEWFREAKQKRGEKAGV